MTVVGQVKPTTYLKYMLSIIIVLILAAIGFISHRNDPDFAEAISKPIMPSVLLVTGILIVIGKFIEWQSSIASRAEEVN